MLFGGDAQKSVISVGEQCRSILQLIDILLYPIAQILPDFGNIRLLCLPKKLKFSLYIRSLNPTLYAPLANGNEKLLLLPVIWKFLVTLMRQYTYHQSLCNVQDIASA